ncbi:hypothetical protein OG563_18055 [Nocardia vinacea]|uniref:Uncharacterized protein n=1 Tax=Nocardia vinacea TaxID=96468 RepID=A0ABZ1Z3U7_9NOCA|nr:hypothetical protein [Nocardia vinacea]
MSFTGRSGSPATVWPDKAPTSRLRGHCRKELAVGGVGFPHEARPCGEIELVGSSIAVLAVPHVDRIKTIYADGECRRDTTTAPPKPSKQLVAQLSSVHRSVERIAGFEAGTVSVEEVQDEIVGERYQSANIHTKLPANRPLRVFSHAIGRPSGSVHRAPSSRHGSPGDT